MQKLKIGDHVRYLNASGGGVVRKIEGKIAWVEDADGFEMPTPIHECVPVEEGDSFIPGYKKPTPPIAPKSVGSTEEKVNWDFSDTQKHPQSPEKEQKKEPPMPHLFIAERPDGEEVSIFLAWLPIDTNAFGHTPLECYLINDSNYTLLFQLWTTEENYRCSLIAEGEIERDTKIFIEELPLDRLNSREGLKLSYIPFKRDHTFTPKPAQTLELKLNVLRLLKKHAYTENDFFDEDALVIPVIEKDIPFGEDYIPEKQLIDLVESSISIPNKDIELETAKLKQREARKARGIKRQQEAPMEIDLHINQLIETSAGLTASDILNLQLSEFRKVMNDAIHNKGQHIIFIHGKGEGILRKAILDELKQKYPKASAQDASFKEYGFGATMVTIH